MVWDTSFGNGTDNEDRFWLNDIPTAVAPPPEAPPRDAFTVPENQQPGWGSGFWEPSSPEPGSRDFLQQRVDSGQLDPTVANYDWLTNNQVPMGYFPQQ